MIDIKDKKKCVGCSACVQCCPKQCISFSVDGEGFRYPLVDRSLCIDCGLCERVCPVINQARPRVPLDTLAAVNPDEKVRLQSSSGGVFSQLAEAVIDRGGVVFGARFDADWRVVHDFTESREGISAFRGSKYTQSDMGDSFRRVRDFLDDGRFVLFSGTPCQVAGLRLFLRKEYENLLTVDFICHGVPSPEVFRRYLSESLAEAGASVKDVRHISFRDKSSGWKQYSLAVDFDAPDSSSPGRICERNVDNRFLRGFVRDFYLRPSCSECPAKELKSGSDITLGDLWDPELYSSDIPNDDKGIGLVMANTDKGLSFARECCGEHYTVDFSKIAGNNVSLKQSSPMKFPRRQFFWMRNIPVAERVRILTELRFVQRHLSVIKSIFK